MLDITYTRFVWSDPRARHKQWDLILMKALWGPLDSTLRRWSMIVLTITQHLPFLISQSLILMFFLTFLIAAIKSIILQYNYPKHFGLVRMTYSVVYSRLSRSIKTV